MTPILPPFLSAILGTVGIYKYPLLFVGVIVEGPFLMIASGFLLHFQVFSLETLFPILLVGDLTGDILWYAAGYHWGERFLVRWGHFVSLTPEMLTKAKALFQRYHGKILFISKITMGFGLAIGTQVTAGISHVPLRTFILLNVLGGIILISVLLSIGYFFGWAYGSIAGNLKTVFLVSALLFIGLVVWGFSRFLKNKILHR